LTAVDTDDPAPATDEEENEPPDTELLPEVTVVGTKADVAIASDEADRTANAIRVFFIFKFPFTLFDQMTFPSPCVALISLSNMYYTIF
jgi:hypothetical protein